MNAYSRTDHDLANALMGATRPRYDVHLADAWRYSMLEVADHILFIRQHQKTIAERDQKLSTGTPVHSAANVRAARELLAYRLPLYLAALRRVADAEGRMSAMGMPVAKSSDAWVLS